MLYFNAKLNQRVILAKAIPLLVYTKMHITMTTHCSTFMPVSSSRKTLLSDAESRQHNQVCWLQIRASGQEQDSVCPTVNSPRAHPLQNSTSMSPPNSSSTSPPNSTSMSPPNSSTTPFFNCFPSPCCAES